MIDSCILNKLNAPTSEQRLNALKTVLRETNFIPTDNRMINNHIHTTYSFSPYSPTAAVFAARSEGLCTAGIVDHDSMGGAKEFIEAGKLIGMPITVGVEARVSMVNTPFENLRTNNPDQTGVSYMVLHGVKHDNIDKVQAFFAPLREKRNERNRRMLQKINELYAAEGVSLNFEADVLPHSNYKDGGTVTERHLMLALARALNKGKALTLLEEYDMVGKLKKDVIPKVYIGATDECPTLSEFVQFARLVDGILAYAYLGDIEVSVTGDKNAQKFEDDNLELLFETLCRFEVKAVTYMPTRNTKTQLMRLRALCQAHNMLEISGEDINSPRQSFIIEKLRDENFSNLLDSTWAIIAHENGGKHEN